jgi:hypothetical protein
MIYFSYYCNSLLLNLPASSLKRFQFVLNSAARAVTNTSKFSHITPVLNLSTGLKLSNVFTTKFSLLLTKLLTQIILPIYALFSLFKTFEILALLPLFHWFILLILHVLKSLIGLFIIWLLFSGIAFLLIFVFVRNVL